MRLYCNIKTVVSITHNPVQHDWTKHSEIDIYFIKEKLESSLICTPCMPNNSQLTDKLTKNFK